MRPHARHLEQEFLRTGEQGILLKMTVGAALLLGVAACQTGAPVTPANVPAALHPYFSACAPGDGASVMQLLRRGELVLSTDFEWKANAANDWDAHANDPLGNPILQLARRPTGLSTYGKAASRVPALGVDADGFFEVNGHRIGLKASEAPCLFAGRPPRTWLPLAYAVKQDCARGKCTSTTVTFKDDVRTVRTSFFEDRARQVTTICSEIKWSRFLGLMSSTLKWCQTGAKLRNTTLSGYEDYSLRMVPVDE